MIKKKISVLDKFGMLMVVPGVIMMMTNDDDDHDDDDDHSWIDQWWSRIDSVGGGKMGSGWVTSTHLTICKVLRVLGCNVIFVMCKS